MPSAQVSLPFLQRIYLLEVDKIIQAIVDDGGVIIKNFTTSEAVERVNSDMRPYLDADKPLGRFLSTPIYAILPAE
jgi:hypothetical protein